MVTEAAQKGSGFEKLTYKHGGFVVGFVLAKRIERVLRGVSIIDPTKLDAQFSGPFDEARQCLWNEVSTRTIHKGPLALLRTLEDAIPILRDAMIAHYGLGADPAITPLRAKVLPSDPYPQKALFDFLSANAPQIWNIT
jgi:hypothetical protein